MSVLMVLRIPVDPDEFVRAAGENKDLIQGISQRGKERGAIHHAFYKGSEGIVVVDEWDSPESFQGFWEAEGENIGQLMAAAGAGEPAPPTFHEKISVGDEF